MEILFVTPDLAPYSGHGARAAMVRSLPKALRSLDHRVTVLSPLYRGIDPQSRNLARRLTKIEVEAGDQTYACELYDGRTPGGVDVLFIGHEDIFHACDELAPEEDDPETIALRAGLLARAAAQIASTREPAFDVVHGHDWPGALALVATRDTQPKLPLVLTLHQTQEQGLFDAQLAPRLGLPAALAEKEPVRQGDRVATLVAGLQRADFTTTVSSAYARELAGGENRSALERVLGELGDRFVGVPNGVDVSVWNPATDPHLRARFEPTDWSGKKRCKSDMQRELGLPLRDDVPLFSVSGTAGTEEGLDLIAKCAPRFLRNDVQLVVQLWDGGELETTLEELSERWPDRLQLRHSGDHRFLHRLIGASDLRIVPARHAPSGYEAMYAQRYGAVPVVRRTGGLADAVVDCDADMQTGSGFVFDEANADELVAALRRATAAWTQRDAFDALAQRIMRIDHSWERSARLYERLYRRGMDT